MRQQPADSKPRQVATQPDLAGKVFQLAAALRRQWDFESSRGVHTTDLRRTTVTLNAPT
jgi:hypothetical protein